MRVTSKGQVTIPIELRERYGLAPGDEVEFLPEPDGLRVVRKSGAPSRGERLVRGLLGKGDVELTTDEIMAMTRGED